MNQKNIFMVIGVILLLQGVFFYTMADNVVTGAFPTIDAAGKTSAIPLMQVMSVLSILVGLISIASRNNASVLWAYTLGFGLFVVLSLKHMLMDHINVPIPALAIQIVIVLACVYLWMQNKKPAAA